MKKVFLMSLVALIITTMIIPAMAAEGDTAQPLYNNISSIWIGLDINESTDTALSDGSVSAYYQVPVEICTQLQVYKNGQWKTLMSWSNSGTGISYAGGYHAVDPGYNYRTRVTGSICNDLGIPIESETETKEVYYPAS